MPLWMGVLETETVFKNFIYILENSLNGELKKYSLIFHTVQVTLPLDYGLIYILYCKFSHVLVYMIKYVHTIES